MLYYDDPSFQSVSIFVLLSRRSNTGLRQSASTTQDGHHIVQQEPQFASMLKVLPLSWHLAS